MTFAPAHPPSGGGDRTAAGGREAAAPALHRVRARRLALAKRSRRAIAPDVPEARARCRAGVDELARLQLRHGVLELQKLT